MNVDPPDQENRADALDSIGIYRWQGRQLSGTAALKSHVDTQGDMDRSPDRGGAAQIPVQSSWVCRGSHQALRAPEDFDPIQSPRLSERRFPVTSRVSWQPSVSISGSVPGTVRAGCRPSWRVCTARPTQTGCSGSAMTMPPTGQKRACRMVAARNQGRLAAILKGPDQGSAANFLSLLCHPDPPEGHVALCDQDKFWLPHKLEPHWYGCRPLSGGPATGHDNSRCPVPYYARCTCRRAGPSAPFWAMGCSSPSCSAITLGQHPYTWSTRPRISPSAGALRDYALADLIHLARDVFLYHT